MLVGGHPQELMQRSPDAHQRRYVAAGHGDDEELQRLRKLTHSRRGYQRPLLNTACGWVQNAGSNQNRLRLYSGHSFTITPKEGHGKT